MGREVLAIPPGLVGERVDPLVGGRLLVASDAPEEGLQVHGAAVGRGIERAAAATQTRERAAGGLRGHNAVQCWCGSLPRG